MEQLFSLKFRVFTCKQETVKGLILVLFCEIRLSSGTLRRISHNSFCSSGCGFELRLTRQFFLAVRLGTRMTDLGSELRVTQLLVDDVVCLQILPLNVVKGTSKEILLIITRPFLWSRAVRGVKLENQVS